MPTLLALALLAASSAAAPHRYDAAWASALPAGSTARLPAGVYRGPWKLNARVRLIASPGAELQGGDPVLTLGGNGIELDNLTVRADPGTIGIAGLNAFGVVLREVRVIGGARGVKLRGGSLDWNGGGAERSSQYGIWLQACAATLSNLQLRHHLGPALYLGHGSGNLRDLELDDAEYGLLAFNAQLELVRAKLQKVRRSGLALVRTSGSVSDCSFEGPFSEAALASTGAPSLALRRNRIRASGGMGIKLLNSTTALEKNEISGGRSDAQGLEGDGIYASNSQVESSGDSVADNGGVGISVMGGRAVFKACRIRGAGQAAAAVSGKGTLVLSGCTLLDGAKELVEATDSTLQNDAAEP